MNGFSLIGIDLLVAILSITLLRILFGILSGVNTSDELAKRDNYAFGISFAGAALGLAFIISAAITGELAATVVDELVNVSVYAVTGIVLLKIGMFINEHLIFNHISMRSAIAHKNVSIGIVQAANFLALGLVISAAINWVETEEFDGLLHVVAMFIAVQVVLLLVTRLRGAIYAKRHDGKSLQSALGRGNSALAIRYAGHLLAVASGASAVIVLVPYDAGNQLLSAGIWLLAAVGVTIFISVVAVIVRTVVLHHIDIVEEVDDQQNIGVASIEAVLYLAIAIFLSPILSMI